MRIHPLAAGLMLIGFTLIILPIAGVPLGHLFTPAGLAVSFIVLLISLFVLTIMEPLTRPKKKGPVHPMTKAGHLFAVVAVVFAGLSVALGAHLGLATAGLFFLLAIVCWVFGAAFRSKA